MYFHACVLCRFLASTTSRGLGPGPKAGADGAPLRFVTNYARPSVTSQDGVTISFGAIDILTGSASSL